MNLLPPVAHAPNGELTSNRRPLGFGERQVDAIAMVPAIERAIETAWRRRPDLSSKQIEIGITDLLRTPSYHIDSSAPGFPAAAEAIWAKVSSHLPDGFELAAAAPDLVSGPRENDRRILRYTKEVTP